jgi:UDP-glucose:glycoprotein glucosyltransferase
MRMTFVHNPTTIDAFKPQSRASWLVSHLLAANLMSKVSPAKLLTAIGFDSPVSQAVLSAPGDLDELTGGVRLEDMDATAYSQYVKSSRLVAREVQVSPGQQALIINGRVSWFACECHVPTTRIISGCGPYSKGRVSFCRL